MEPSDALHCFRHSLYECLHYRADALFELTDAILCADAAVPSPVHLSLQPAHRRGWGSFYAALAHGRIDAEVLRNLLARHPLAGSGATPVYAVDMNVWPRCDAECSPLLKATITILLATRPAYRGRMAYQFIAQLNFVRESWTAPLDVERVRPAKDANEVAAKQVKVLLGRRSCCVYARSARNPLERVMNSIRNALGMRETEMAREPRRPWNPHFYAVFAQVHNTL